MKNEKRLKILHRAILYITVALMIVQLILLVTKNPFANGVLLYAIITVLSIVLIKIALMRKKPYHALAYALYAVCCIFCIAVNIVIKIFYP